MDLYETYLFRVYDYWFWVPFIAPHVGAVLGAWLYLICVGIHHEPETSSDTNNKEPEADYDRNDGKWEVRTV